MQNYSEASLPPSDSFSQYSAGSAAGEPFFECPRQDPPGIVVDHRMQIRSRAIEQADDRHVQVEEFARRPE